MKRFLSYAGSLLAVASLGFLIRSIVLHAGEIPSLEWDVFMLTVLLSNLLFYLAAAFILFCVWSLVLRNGGIDLPFLQAYIILGRSQIAKYLPGNIFHFVGRAALGERAGIPVHAIIVSTGIEMAIAVVAALLMTLGGIGMNALTLPWLYSWFQSAHIVVPRLILIAGVLIITGLMLSSGRARAWIGARLRYLQPRKIGLSMLLYIIVLAASGIFILLLERGIWRNAPELPWYSFSFGYSLAWLLGFIVPGAPGGIGIREAVFVALFGNEIGQGVAAGLAVVLRLITTVSDLITFGVATWLGRKRLAGKSSSF